MNNVDLFGSISESTFTTNQMRPLTKWELSIPKDSIVAPIGYQGDQRNDTKQSNYGILQTYLIDPSIFVYPNIDLFVQKIPASYYRIEYFLNVENGYWGGGKCFQDWTILANKIGFTKLIGAKLGDNIINYNFPQSFNFSNIPIVPKIIKSGDKDSFAVDFNVECSKDGCWCPTTNIEFYSYMNIKLTFYKQKYCSDNLDTPVCLTYCINNIDDCVTGNIKYCINNVKPLESKILDICSNCYDVISAYYSVKKNIPQYEYDSAFYRLCSNLQVNPANYKTYTSQTSATINTRIAALCACHLNTSVYDNYYQELTEEVEILQSLNLGTKQCLFPECSTSLFRSSATLGNNACSSVCLNVTDLRVNGTFSNLTINSKNECQDIVRPIQRCIDDTSCSQGRLCKNNICVKGCNNDAGCSEYQSCIGGICEQMETCEVDADCPGNKKCSSGKECILRDRCKEDVDCGLGNVCIDNFCAKKEGIESWQIGVIVGVGIVAILVFLFIITYIVKK
jgi:hypothetical protein